MVSTIRVMNACPNETGLNYPDWPSEKMCLPQTAMRPPQPVTDTWVSSHPSHVAHLSKMQDFQGEGSNRLDAFFDHVEELADFYQ